MSERTKFAKRKTAISYIQLRIMEDAEEIEEFDVNEMLCYGDVWNVMGV